jgi:hypothetical protein
MSGILAAFVEIHTIMLADLRARVPAAFKDASA